MRSTEKKLIKRMQYSSYRHLIFYLVTILLVIMLTAGCQAKAETDGGSETQIETSSYNWQKIPSPPGVFLCMSAYSPSQVFASMVDQNVYSSIYNYDGTDWKKQAEISLDGMVTISEDSTWGVGYPAPGMYNYDGTSWVAQDNVGIQMDHYTDITRAGEDNIWVTGVDSELKGTILHFDGSKWSQQLIVDGWMSYISAADAKHVWAIGKDTDGNDVIYFFNGKEWKKQGSIDGINSIGVIAAVDATHLWATTTTGVLFYDGKVWSQQFQEQTVQIPGLSGEESMVNMSGISAADPSHVWCVGFYYVPKENDPYTQVDHRYGIFFYNGESWVQQYESEEQISEVYSLDDENIWAFGGNTLLFGTKAK
jgi:hypothetical protein